MPESLSIAKPKSARKLPTSIHVQRWLKTGVAGSFVKAAPPAPVNAMKRLKTAETPTDAHATAPMNASLRTRRPTSQLTTAPASGAKTMTESQWLDIRKS